ncbi:MAG: ribosome maturation factor RimP [Acidobacteriota bacterium]|nr:ribosome maturation factor RimP [Blastocatellia bacterium]MDW8240580.1 ribosome maturation factor RimP [Acidobacteriota bacterium]
MSSYLVERITAVVEPVVVGEGYELVHVELVGPAHRQVLRLYIDKPGGVTIDDCAAVSQYISPLLDVEDLIPTRYVLEVSSPGLERGLYKPADYQRFAGREAKIQTTEEVEGRRNFHGQLLGIEGDIVTIAEQELGHEVAIPYSMIRKAHLVFQWGKGKS